MVTGDEKVGIIFLGENQKLIFVCFEDKRETIIDLNYIKRIYFNIKGSVNMRNYNMKTNNEKFMQFVQINNIKVDFKFKNEDDLELLIKGLYVVFKHKTPIINKEIIYKNFFFTSSYLFCCKYKFIACNQTNFLSIYQQTCSYLWTLSIK